jgi:hypothetical protein
MASGVPGFDDWLTAALRSEAATVGESEQAYVARAVVTRLLADRARRGDPARAELLDHVASLGLSAAEFAPDRTERPTINDPHRLRVLYDTGLLDAEPDSGYDRIVQMAADALAVPAAAMSLVDRDRQFLANAVGLTGELAVTRQTPLADSVCQYVVEAGEPLIVEDARIHPILKDHPAVVGNVLVAYAGIPLVNPAGHSIGTLCVWDQAPRQWSTGHIDILRDLAAMLSERIFEAANDTLG